MTDTPSPNPTAAVLEAAAEICEAEGFDVLALQLGLLAKDIRER